MDGFAVAERVKASGNTGLSVMMLTSDDLPADIPKAARYGLDAHLIEPVHRADLFEAIAQAMANAEKRRAGVGQAEPTPADSDANANTPDGSSIRRKRATDSRSARRRFA
jgi:DNA-binding NarL/FixJ family response regulator